MAALLGEVNLSQASAANEPHQILLPVVSKSAVATVFGAFLDSIPVDNGTETMAAAGMTWMHIPIYWSKVEPKEGDRKWNAVNAVDNALLAASSKYLSPILYVNDIPDWAVKSGFNGCGPLAQDKFAAMASFLTDLVARYSVAPYNVKYFELWSEEDAFGVLGCWGDPGDSASFGGAYYGEMLKVAYPAVKKGNPQAQVLFGGLLMGCNPDHIERCVGNPAENLSVAHFLEGALNNGAGPYFDGISFHAYDYYGSLGSYSNANWGSAWNTTGPVASLKVAYLRSLLSRYGLTGKFLMNTEAAVLCGKTGQEPTCVTEAHATTVSIYIVQVFASGIADGLRSVFWFSTDGWRGSQLLDSRLAPLSTYKAYTTVSSRLSEAAFTGVMTRYAHIKGYEFSQNGARVWVLWSVAGDGKPVAVNLGRVPSAMYNMYGDSLPVANPLNVDLEPVFVVFNP